MNVFIVGLLLGIVAWALALLYVCWRWLGPHPKEWAHALRITWEGHIEKWMVQQALCFLFLGQMLSIFLWTLKLYPY